MLRCKDATRLVSAQFDRILSVRERLALRTHLLVCTGCARFERQLRFMHAALGRYRRGETPPPDDDPA
ncbi:zf-HC2 domain-containing protein [Nitrogeniibacter mangrovi]|uniref:Zf-HC2 domain-containing protein n=1 Tax=Nitrogeniibacter mangrovi TaxID=2016596 RepID=A0A6C1B0Z1_9RHOO|nr:zf-HC2 domain-containing protein [Nitrogeniibacter mangrovi]QID16659.1 zf-HC2 domain-containing protein [Nitrogeniibacter mangrovi]